MPPLPGEESVLTVFADLHYYFAPPVPKPLNHRFDKGSYLYIYRDTNNRSRIEVANNPGTADQDAFHGPLDSIHVRHSIKFPTLCTVVVDYHPTPQQPPNATPQDWQLPSVDPRSDQQTRIRLHTIDIYFWTTEDATQFLDTLGRVLPGGQIESDRVASAPHTEQPLSTVVQQLESVAISDPAYQNGQTPNSRSEAAPVAAPTFAPPPTSAPESTTQQGSTDEKKQDANFTPLAYNPAAPAAPEPIRHREKTPPPEDSTAGTGLAAAAAADHGVPFTLPNQVPGAFAPPPTSAAPGLPYSSPPTAAAAGYVSPPPSAGLSHPMQSPGLQSPGLAAYTQPFPGHGSQTQPWNPASPPSGTMSFAPPPQDPNAHLYGQQMYGSPQSPPQFGMGHPPPIGGYSNYSYDQAQVPRTGTEYDVHSQVYRPTEAEASSHYQKAAQKAMKNPGQRPRKLEERAESLESGVNRFFKKLEKKIG
ncbi:hypothetical protein N7474_010048 [Penicillium riverlandense]|uniref:uncharacterized protein n=1 Tax=Penicillium riverlandense TaxID=1903569 RepID=UPI002546CF18|nr:uncharacterized protein N7474_010048 [Penicillium riverlandense]KAJ5808779.1 hypothetical protein N7474_010048 [Penicillium riverlandense]